jgi:dUTP pyrophosphatase
MKVKVINRSSHALPAYETGSSAGMDVRANIGEAIVLAPMSRALIPTGLYLEIPHGYECQVRPRSGLALKKGVSVLNTPGTIDADYRGEVGVILFNMSDSAFTVENGERIAQLVFAPVLQVEWDESESLSETERGAGGFGSTGTH